MPERNVTPNPERFRLWCLMECTTCGGRGKTQRTISSELKDGLTYAELDVQRCETCRGEGRERVEVASCASPEAVGVALVTLAREGEWSEGCQFGLLDSEGEKGLKWLILPWPDTARTVSSAARTLAKSKRTSTPDDILEEA
jgi:hypothetical protein